MTMIYVDDTTKRCQIPKSIIIYLIVFMIGRLLDRQSCAIIRNDLLIYCAQRWDRTFHRIALNNPHYLVTMYCNFRFNGGNCKWYIVCKGVAEPNGFLSICDDVRLKVSIWKLPTSEMIQLYWKIWNTGEQQFHIMNYF